MANGNPPPGTYQRTSRNIRFEPAEQGRYWLIAECEKEDGSWQQSRLKYKTLPTVTEISGLHPMVANVRYS